MRICRWIGVLLFLFFLTVDSRHEKETGEDGKGDSLPE